MIVATLALALTPIVCPAPSPASQQPHTGESAVDADVLKSAIDRSLRSLRSRQDVGSGAYGGVEETALGLQAFLASPRGYGVSDGPFMFRALEFLVTRQAVDGAICDEGATPADRLTQTLEAARALASIDEEPAMSTRSRALSFLRLTQPPETHVPDLEPERAKVLATVLLGSADADGAWDGVDGPVATTARNVLVLCGAHAALREAGSTGTQDVRALPELTPADRERVLQALERGAAFLAESTTDEGEWGAMGRGDAGVTAMVAGALLALPEPRPASVQSAIDAALARLRGLQKPDGGIHDGSLHNYVTSASILALARAGGERNDAAVARARTFLQELQADEGEGYDASHRYYGGVGYGGDERPDLSNLQLALEALAAAGLEAGDPTFQKALTFLQRTQNRSESNDLELREAGIEIRPGDDGGAAYAPGESKAGMAVLPDGTQVPRSYGSMSYALLRGYLFAGLGPDDPRVQAVLEWLRANYALDVNPGFEASADPTAPYQGLFYYFLSMAKALDTLGEESFVDAAGVAHPWREELAGRIVAMQRPDGSWVNENSPRWWEGNPVLATAYAMLILDATLP